MRKQIKNIVLLAFSLIFSLGMLYALFTDLNFFVTNKVAEAEIVDVSNSDSSTRVSIGLDYYNEYLNRNVRASIILKRHDASQAIANGDKQLSIHYVKNYPDKIYIENINTPRWLVLVFEVVMIALMIFLFYNSFRNLRRKIT